MKKKVWLIGMQHQDGCLLEQISNRTCALDIKAMTITFLKRKGAFKE